MNTTNFFSALVFRANAVLAGLLLIAVGSRAQDVFDCSGIDPAPDDVLSVKLVAGSLTKPVDLQAPPGDTSRIFIVEQRGVILIVDLTTDTLLSTPFLNIASRVSAGGETGLLGLAFHPNYSDNGLFFVNYTRAGGPTGLETVIARYKVSAGDVNRADTAEVILLSFSQPFANHNGGQLQFGPKDGFLYCSTGDGGDAGDPGNRAQNPGVYLGKILRFDVDSAEPYGIPEGNPFAAVGDGILDEIWDLGLRNPWRFCFDPETGDMYIADVGQGSWEEIDFEPAPSTGGMNYEWKVREGNHDFSASTAFGPGARRSPILEYSHSSGAYTGCSITGGVIYRGCSMPALRGSYFFADYCSDFVRTFRYENGSVVNLKNRTTELNATLGADRIDDISSFGVDGHGEVYICDLQNSQKGDTSAKLYRIVAKNAPVKPKTFSRGNANNDNVLDMSDAVFTLGHLFLGAPAQVPCEDALDSNDDGNVDVSDPVYTLLGLFAGGPPPSAPFPDCGVDPTDDTVGCATSTCGS